MKNLVFCAAVAMLALAGCGGSDAPAPKAEKPKLSEADQALVAKQKLCLVADEPLGSMGTPIKVTVKGRDVFLCCEGCKEAVEKNPDKYLAKLDANGAVVPEKKEAEAPKEPVTDKPADAPKP